ncbi:MAG: DMT family transporter [Alistipes sp.]|nr:DMT family transporter [Alistipes sp.]
MTGGKIRYNMALLAANVLFGANFSFYVSLTRYYLNFEQIFMLQVLTAAAFFIPFAILSRRSYRITVEDFGSIFIVALLVIYGWMYLLLWGASCTSPIDASTIATLGPVFTLIIARIVQPQKTSWVRLTGIVIALAGAAALLVDKGESLLGSNTEAFGNALVLCAVISIAANTVLIKPQLQRYGALTVMGWYYIIGFAMVAPFFWVEIDGLNLLRLPWGALAELLYILIFGTVLPMWLLYLGSAHLSSLHTALYRYMQPVVATCLSLLRGQNNIDRTNIVGASLIFVGIILVASGNLRRRPATERRADNRGG